MNNDLEASILSKSAIRGGLHLYKYNEAIKLIELCRQSHLPVLGIDSFKITTTKTEPFLDHSVDLSECKNSHEAAKEFLESKKMLGFVFEVVY